MIKRLLLVSSLSFLCPLAAFAASPYQVADLATGSKYGPVSSSAAFVGARTDGVAFFLTKLFQTAGLRSELWRTDGTAAGTFKLVDNSDPYGTYLQPTNPIMAGDTLYFIGLKSTSSTTSSTLWKSDGTVAGTQAIASLPFSALPLLIGASGNNVFYYTNDYAELWAHTASGEVKLASMTYPTSSPKRLSRLTAGGTFFLGNDAGLWKSDGTAAGTINLTTNPAQRLVSFRNTVYFVANTAAAGEELWTTDGTPAGTHIVTDLRAGTEGTFALGKSTLAAAANGLVIAGANGELALSDGSASGTHVIRTGTAPGQQLEASVVNGIAYFTFDDGQHGVELWRSDGTEAGTRLVRDAFTQPAAISALTAAATRVFYCVTGSSGNLDLWVSDGTETGTHPVYSAHDAKWNVSNLLSISGDRVFFGADDGVAGREPWVSDGTEAGTHMILNIALETAASSAPTRFLRGSRYLYFCAEGTSFKGLWRTDGTPAGTQPVSAGEDTDFNLLAEVGGNLFYVKSHALWRWNAGGELQLRSNVTADASQVTVSGGKLYFPGGDGLWSTDGTVAGTTRVSTDAGILVDVAGRGYAAAPNCGVYVFDASPARTFAHPCGGNGGVSIFQLGGMLIGFMPSTGDGMPVVRMTGNAADITPLVTIARVAAPQYVTASGKQLYWIAGRQLWTTDGTVAGTQLLKEWPDLGITELRPFRSGVMVAKSLGLYYQSEIWVSDGTAAGTRLLFAQNAWETAVADGMLYIISTDAAHGTELWQSDGTTTQLAFEINPGSTSSMHALAGSVGDRLYFTAETAATGHELWAVPLDLPALSIDDARTTEAAGRLTLTARLTHASSRSVTAHWKTADGTAVATRDYTAAAGDLTFAPGETAKTISFSVPHLLTQPATTRFFWVELTSGDVAVERSAGAAVIEDSDLSADVSLTIAPGATQGVVSNAGPSAASNIRFCSRLASAAASADLCQSPFELAAGETRAVGFPLSMAGQSVTASVAAFEPDPNPSNNSLTTPFPMTATLSPAAPRRGDTGTITVTGLGVEKGPFTFYSESTFIVTVDPPVQTAGSGTATATFHAKNPGRTFVDIAGSVTRMQLTITVAEVAGTTTVTVTPENPHAGESGSLLIQATGDETGPYTLTSSDATVVTVDGTAAITTGSTAATAKFHALREGTATITVQGKTSGATAAIHVLAASTLAVPTVVATPQAPFVFGGSNAVAIRVQPPSGNSSVPTGDVVFFEDGTRLATRTLASATASLTGLKATAGTHTYTATYSGDANFTAASTQWTATTGRGAVTITARDQLYGRFAITVHGIAGYAPTGFLQIARDGRIGTVMGPLEPVDESSSAALAVTQGSSTILVVTYSGDSSYAPVTLSVPYSTSSRSRAVRH